MQTPESVHVELARWLEPVAATSAAADVLAAAMSIVVAKRESGNQQVASAVVTALLHSQNVGDPHRRELKALATALPEALLDSIERSNSRAYASAKRWALESLQSIPNANESAWCLIRERMARWVALVHCPSRAELNRDDDYAKHLSEGLRQRIGTDVEGTHRILGIAVRLHPVEATDLGDVVPSLMHKRPLAPAIDVLFAAAVATAISQTSRNSWGGLRWVVLLNEIDRPATITQLRELSDSIRTMPLDPGLHAEFGKRVAALLLWLTGSEDNEVTASAMRVSFETSYPYETEYLPHPSRSWYALERRHVEQTLDDTGVFLVSRLKRAERYLPDPAVVPPEPFLREGRPGIMKNSPKTAYSSELKSEF